jgi:hypothetical protein
LELPWSLPARRSLGEGGEFGIWNFSGRGLSFKRRTKQQLEMEPDYYDKKRWVKAPMFAV